MMTFWEVVLALPICVATVCFLLLKVQKVPLSYVLAGVVYAGAYFAVFHFWLKAL